MEKANRTQMKQINKNIVRQILKQKRKATKPELAEYSNLSVVTVNTLICEMVADGEVVEGEEVPSNGGRPSRQFLYNGNYKQALILYGHEENKKNLFHRMVVNLFGECLEKSEEFIDKVDTASFEPWISEAFAKFKNVNLIAFGLPGVEEEGVITINDYPGIIGDEFLSYYEKKYRVPIVFENDVNAAVRGYYRMQNPSEVRNTVGIYYPRSFGPGAGIIIGGEIYKGSKNFAGEFAWISVKPSWNEIDFDNSSEVVEMLSQVILIYSCVLAPERFVLYGDFLTKEINEEVMKKVGDLLQGKFFPYIEVKKKIEEDFGRGMVEIALRELTKKEEGAVWY